MMIAHDQIEAAIRTSITILTVKVARKNSASSEKSICCAAARVSFMSACSRGCSRSSAALVRLLRQPYHILRRFCRKTRLLSSRFYSGGNVPSAARTSAGSRAGRPPGPRQTRPTRAATSRVASRQTSCAISSRAPVAGPARVVTTS